MRHLKGFHMRKFVLATAVLFGGWASAQAIQPLQADLNPVHYTPYVNYYDTGTQQTFYYDSAVGAFFIHTTSATDPAGTVPLTSGGTDQAACQAKANSLAASGVLSHLNYIIGAFEGVGMGGSSGCATCIPGGAMTLTGDAAAFGANGIWYRVRAWR